MVVSGELAAVGASFVWALNSVNFFIAGKRVGSPVVNHIRLWMALFAMMIIHLVVFGLPFPLHAEYTRFQWLGLSGIVGFALGDAALFESFVLLGPRLAMTIATTNPIFGAIGSWLVLGERLSLLEIGAIALTMGAVAWVVSERKADGSRHEKNGVERGSSKKIGIVLALIGALCQGMGMLLSKMGMYQEFSPISANMIRLFTGTMVIFLITSVRGKLPTHLKKMKDLKALRSIMYGAVLGPVFGVMLALYSVSHINVGVATTLTSLSPVFLIPLSYFIYKEKVTIRTVMGSLLVIAGSSALFFI